MKIAKKPKNAARNTEKLAIATVLDLQHMKHSWANISARLLEIIINKDDETSNNQEPNIAKSSLSETIARSKKMAFTANAMAVRDQASAVRSCCKPASRMLSP